MKKVILISLTLIILLGLTGCNQIEIGLIENSSSHEMKGSYYSLTGTKGGTVTVKADKPVEVTVNIVTKSGSIDVSIFKDKDNYAYEGHDLLTSKFTVTLTDPGTYTIRAKAKKHRGSYTFTW